MFQNTSPLPTSFYNRASPKVAKDLLGKLLVRNRNGTYLVGMIVETEAYLSTGDSAAHSYKGKSTRNQSLYLDAGHLYVHQMRHHNLLDIVTEGQGVPGSVLLRALEPIEGIHEMMEARGVNDAFRLTNGPGKLCQALGITRAMDGVDITRADSTITVVEGSAAKIYAATTSSRVGIRTAKELPLRFYLVGNPFVSKLRASD